MPTAKVYDMTGKSVEEVELNPTVFGVEVNEAVLHQVVTVQLTNRRQGNASTKTRAEVSGGSKKPYRQKGTGRARQGSTRAPHFKGGGVVFGPRPHAYEAKVPRKMRRIAIRSALSDKALNQKVILLKNLKLDEPRTKDMRDLISKLPVEKNILVMLPERDENVVLAAKNLPSVKVQHVASINVVELLKHEFIILPLATLQHIEDVFGEAAVPAQNEE